MERGIRPSIVNIYTDNVKLKFSLCQRCVGSVYSFIQLKKRSIMLSFNPSSTTCLAPSASSDNRNGKIMLTGLRSGKDKSIATYKTTVTNARPTKSELKLSEKKIEKVTATPKELREEERESYIRLIMQAMGYTRDVAESAYDAFS